MQPQFGFVHDHLEAVFFQVGGELSQVVNVHGPTIAAGRRLGDTTTYDTEWIMRTVTITGTRNTGHRTPEEYARIFEAYVGPFANHDAHFCIGGAVGVDSLALVWLAENTAADLTVVVPGTVGQQPPEARQAIARTRDRIKEIVELRAAELESAAYHARNRWMVDRSSMTIGFPHRDESGSGTWQTINYTSDQGKPRLIVPV